MYRPTNDSDFDATYRDYLTSGHVALGALDAPTLDELASCARAKLACPAWETDAALANFAADCEAGARRLLDALYGTGSQPAIRPGTFYVMDRLARSVEAAIVSGPHATRAAADADRRTWNSAGDYVTARATLQGGAIHIIEDREV